MYILSTKLPVVWRLECSGRQATPTMMPPKAILRQSKSWSTLYHIAVFYSPHAWITSFLSPNLFLKPNLQLLSKITYSFRLLASFSPSSVNLEYSNIHLPECCEYPILYLFYENSHWLQDQGSASTSNADVAAVVPTVDLAMIQRPPQAHQVLQQTHNFARRLKPKQSAENGHT
jgi:hypothetical protein